MAREDKSVGDERLKKSRCLDDKGSRLGLYFDGEVVRLSPTDWLRSIVIKEPGKGFDARTWRYDTEGEVPKMAKYRILEL